MVIPEAKTYLFSILRQFSLRFFFGNLQNPTCVTQWEETLLVVLTQTGSLACMLCELSSAICQITWTKTVSG